MFFIKIRMLHPRVWWVKYDDVESFEFVNGKIYIYKKNTLNGIGLNLFDKIIIKKKK